MVDWRRDEPWPDERPFRAWPSGTDLTAQFRLDLALDSLRRPTMFPDSAFGRSAGGGRRAVMVDFRPLAVAVADDPRPNW